MEPRARCFVQFLTLCAHLPSACWSRAWERPWSGKGWEGRGFCLARISLQELSFHPSTFQIANHTGYIKVDWKLVERDVNKAKQQLKFHSSGNKMSPEVKSRVDEVRQFSQGVCRCPAGGTAGNGIEFWAPVDPPPCKYQEGVLV